MISFEQAESEYYKHFDPYGDENPCSSCGVYSDELDEDCICPECQEKRLEHSE